MNQYQKVAMIAHGEVLWETGVVDRLYAHNETGPGSVNRNFSGFR
jgi:hypothetical protein